MPKRTIAEWQLLIEQQKTSGLGQVAFCKQNKICPKRFAVHKHRCRGVSKQRSALVQVQPPQKQFGTGVSLYYQGIEIRFTHADPTLIASVVKQLA